MMWSIDLTRKQKNYFFDLGYDLSDRDTYLNHPLCFYSTKINKFNKNQISQIFFFHKPKSSNIKLISCVVLIEGQNPTLHTIELRLDLFKNLYC